MKKSIWLFLILSSWFLKQLTEFTSTTVCGHLFQRFRTLTEKYSLNCITYAVLFYRLPVSACDHECICHRLTGKMTVAERWRCLLTILKSWIRSARFRLSSNDQSLTFWSLSWYSNDFKSSKSKVKRCCTLSIADACPFCSGDSMLVKSIQDKVEQDSILYNRTIIFEFQYFTVLFRSPSILFALQ